MQASKVTREVLEAAAREVGVEVQVKTLNAKGTRHRVKVNPGEGYDPADTDPRGPNGRKRSPNRKYQRTSASGFSRERRVWAVCWHGFRDYFRAVYRREPGAVFRTAVAVWKGSEDFEARFRQSGYKNIGSQVYPLMAKDACLCADRGEVEDRGDSGGVTFGTLVEGRGLENVRVLRRSDLLKCRFTILMAEHYRADGSCKCDDREHRAKMIAEWEYSEGDFAGIPLRAEGARQ